MFSNSVYLANDPFILLMFPQQKLFLLTPAITTLCLMILGDPLAISIPPP